LIEGAKNDRPPVYLSQDTVYQMEIGGKSDQVRVLSKEWPKELFETLDES